MDVNYLLNFYTGHLLGIPYYGPRRAFPSLPISESRPSCFQVRKIVGILAAGSDNKFNVIDPSICTPLVTT